MGGFRGRHSGAAQPDCARQSFPRHADTRASGTIHSPQCCQSSRSRRDQGAGKRQAGAGSGGRRRPQSADGRTARLRQVDAGVEAALHPAAAFGCGIAGSLDDPFHRRPAFRRQALGSQAVSHAASFGDHGSPHRRRLTRPAGRGFACPSRRALSRRVSGIYAAGARCPASASGKRRMRHRTRQSPGLLSGADPAHCGHESLPLRYGG